MSTQVPDNTILIQALKSISDCVCISDLDDNFIFVNESFLKTYGYTEEELLGKPISIVRSDNNCPAKVSDIFSKTLEGGWQGELINRRKDGSEFPVTLATSVILDEKGKFIAVMGIAKDITETKRLQAKFRSVANLFQSLGPDPIKNINTIVTCACDVIGGAATLYNKIDERAHTLVIWAGHNLPPEIAMIDSPYGHICYEATIKGIDKTVVLNDLTSTTYALSDPNVALFGLKSYLGAPVRMQGKTIGSLAVVDVTTRNFTTEEIDLVEILARAISQEEERQNATMILETAIRQSPSGILIADAPDVNIRIANSKAIEILYGESEISMYPDHFRLKRTWSTSTLDGTLIPGENLPLTQAIRYGKVTENEEFIIHSGNGTKHYVSVNAAPVRNNEGTITAGVVLFHDITGKRNTEMALQQKVDELERFNNLMIGRELKMIELKKEINDLLVKSGLQEKYMIHD